MAARLRPKNQIFSGGTLKRRKRRMKSTLVILASSSPRRVELLRRLGLDFKVVPSDIREIEHEDLSARELAQINAYRKARSIAKKYPDALVLGADTIVSLETKL